MATSPKWTKRGLSLVCGSGIGSGASRSPRPLQPLISHDGLAALVERIQHVDYLSRNDKAPLGWLYDQLEQEYTSITAQGTKYGLSTQVLAYQAAWRNLNVFLGGYAEAATAAGSFAIGNTFTGMGGIKIGASVYVGGVSSIYKITAGQTAPTAYTDSAAGSGGNVFNCDGTNAMVLSADGLKLFAFGAGTAGTRNKTTIITLATGAVTYSDTWGDSESVGASGYTVCRRGGYFYLSDHNSRFLVDATTGTYFGSASDPGAAYSAAFNEDDFSDGVGLALHEVTKFVSGGFWTPTGGVLSPSSYNFRTCWASSAHTSFLAVGGSDGTHATANVFTVDMATGATITSLAPLNTARGNPALCLLADGRIVAFGGHQNGSGSTFLDSIEVYDPTANRWTTQTAVLPTAGQLGFAVQVDSGRVLYLRSNVAGEATALAYWDPWTGTWYDRDLVTTRSITEWRDYTVDTYLGSGGGVLLYGYLEAVATAREALMAALEDETVHRSNVETITGAKTFTATTTHSGVVNVTNTTPCTSATTGALTLAAGIGVSTSSVATSGTVYGVNALVESNPASASTLNTLCGYFIAQVTQDNAYAVNTVSGTRGYARHKGTGTVSTMHGVYGLTEPQNTGAVTTAYAGYFAFNLAGAQTTTAAHGVRGNITCADVAGTITNAYAIRASISKTGSNPTITNAYGVYIDAVTAGSTLNYAVLSAGAGLWKCSDSTDSTSSTTGSVVTAGGIGAAKALWVGGLANVAGVATMANATEASSHTVAGTVVSGGLAVAKRVFTPKAVITEEGGFAVRLVAGENLSRGNVVYSKQASGADGKVWKAPAGSEMPIGVVFADANADAEVLVVTTGIAYVLPLSTITAVRGDVIFCGAEAGRVDQSASTPTSDHWKEVGHFIETGSGAGSLARAVLHFN